MSRPLVPEDKKKIAIGITLSPRNHQWLKSQASASETVDKILDRLIPEDWKPEDKNIADKTNVTIKKSKVKDGNS